MTFRILTYNLEFGARAQEDEVYEILVHADADVVALTEADDPHVVARLAERLQMEPVWAEGSGDRHVATFSRHPIEHRQIYNRPPLTQAALETEIRLPGLTLTVYNVHLLPILLLPFEFRRWQALGRLLQIIRERQVGPHLIVGDLNSIAPGDRVLHRRNPPRMQRIIALQAFRVIRLALPRLLKAGYTDCYRTLHPDDDGFTFMPQNPTTRYDYIMADSRLAPALRRCDLLKEPPAVYTASDHFPLFADFDLQM